MTGEKEECCRRDVGILDTFHKRHSRQRDESDGRVGLLESREMVVELEFAFALEIGASYRRGSLHMIH